MQTTEHNEQVALIKACKLLSQKHPELGMLFAIPNGGYRNIITAKKMKAEGVRAGVPDLFLPVPTKNYRGLFVEMKAGKGRLTKQQRDFIKQLEAYKYKVIVAYSAQSALHSILAYIKSY